jgi:hypothetical protein
MERKKEEEEVESLINLVLNNKIGVKENIYILKQLNGNLG